MEVRGKLGPHCVGLQATVRTVRSEDLINYEKALTDLFGGWEHGSRTVSRSSKSTITRSGLEVWTVEGVVK